VRRGAPLSHLLLKKISVTAVQFVCDFNEKAALHAALQKSE